VEGLNAISIPLAVRIELCRAAVQTIADRQGVRMLHIKGAAVDPVIRPNARSGTDVDVLCDPARIDEMHARLREHGWRLHSTFDDGSPFAHAQTYWHPDWGYLDLHRRFPGIGIADDDAFALLWHDRGPHTCAGRAAQVPSLDAQIVLLMLNLARRSEDHGGEVERAWAEQSDDDRARRTRLVAELRAEVALAAATGELERYRDRREYALWKAVSDGGSRTREWWARVRAAGTTWEAIRIVLRAPRPNLSRLTRELGREPTGRDVTAAMVRRARTAVNELLTARRAR